jgi:prepilin-type N-terminal cleavage/methylation domain-containing protein
MKSNHKIVSRTRKRRLPVGSSLARRANGFTLIELLVVMSLIAILASLAIMFFPNAA